MAGYGWRHEQFDKKRTPFLGAIAGAGFGLILLFLANYAYVYGALFKSGFRVHNLNILAVDLDGSMVGKSLSVAYQSLSNDEFPEFQFKSAEQYPTPQSVRDAVCRGDYWGAVYASSGASTRLNEAFEGGEAASNYSAADALGLVINSARYPAVQLGDIGGNLQTIVGVTRGVYLTMNGQTALSSLNTSDANAAKALFNPILSTTVDIQPTNQGARVLYNTIGIVFPLLQQFFFHMAMHNFHLQYNMHGRLHHTRITFIRLIIGVVYTFLSALMVTGALWAFSEGWGLNGAQFVLTWMVYWLLMHVGFLVMDAAVAFIPAAFLSFFVLTWIIVNIASTIYPFELSPGFYRVGYALPGHEAYQILVQIWSGGCNNQLNRALPVLFAWEVLGLFATVMGVMYRSKQGLNEMEDTVSVDNTLTDREASNESKEVLPEDEARL